MLSLQPNSEAVSVLGDAAEDVGDPACGCVKYIPKAEQLRWDHFREVVAVLPSQAGESLHDPW